MSAPPRPTAGALLAQREAAVGGPAAPRAGSPTPRAGSGDPGPLGGAGPRGGTGDPRALGGSGPRGGTGAPVPPLRAPVAGQAVVDGVMMRGERAWAVAVRAHDGIRVTRATLPPARRRGALAFPVLRGVAAVAEALALGARGLAVSGGRACRRAPLRRVRRRARRPLRRSRARRRRILEPLPAVLLEGPLRIALLVGGLALAARRPGLRRMLEYHGAEHMAVGCHEAGAEPSPEAARLMPRVHARCGTSLLLAMTVVAAVAFAPLAAVAAPWALVARLAAVPLVAGLGFELFRGAVRRPDRRWARALLGAGLRLQRLTTREPDAAQLEVAVAALRAVVPPGAAEASRRPAA